jgi:D-glycerate 3-kinase
MEHTRLEAKSYLLPLIDKHGLDASYLGFVKQYLSPVISDALKKHRQGDVLVFAINGAQGSGKSTAADFIKALLAQEFALRSVVLSLDDFYLTKKERLQLAKEKHPLLVSRGVPGTHDLALAEKVINDLKSRKSKVLIPRFDKKIDDRAGYETFNGQVDVVIFEGWCLGLKPQQSDELSLPVNEFELQFDADSSFRSLVNEHLASDYQQLFNHFDYLLMLQVPAFEQVYQWRLKQEQQLLKNTGSTEHSLLDKAKLKHFISHFQRLTEHALNRLPEFANAVITLNVDHQMTGLTFTQFNQALSSEQRDDAGLISGEQGGGNEH